MDSDYVHDVFISYRRNKYQDPWLLEEFIPLFSTYLENDIADVCRREPKSIFVDRADQTGIDPGEDWKNALHLALRTSRCLVTLWQPMYFYSRWCLVEWRSFHERAQLTQRRVIVPLSIHDGESFPDDARALQASDFSKFVLVGAGFRETKLYIEFQDRLKQFARKVAEAVRDAPDFADWPVAAAGDIALPHVPQKRL